VVNITVPDEFFTDLASERYSCEPMLWFSHLRGDTHTFKEFEGKREWKERKVTPEKMKA